MKKYIAWVGVLALLILNIFQGVRMTTLEAELKEFKSKLKVAMEEYGIKTWRLYDNTKITLVPDGADKEVEEIDTKSLQKDHPELFIEGSPYVKRTVKRGRSGFVRITAGK